MPRVSVVIPTWERARSLGRALDSVLSQTNADFEVIVIDDGSTGDAAQRAAMERADPRVRYLKLPVNRGVSAARNAGVAAAIGTYVAFLDDDDEWLPEKLQHQLAVMERADASVCAVYTARFTVDVKTGRITTVRSRRVFRPADGNTITTSSIMIKRECLTRAGLFDEELEAGEDYDMWIRLGERFRFEYIDIPLLKYYVHPDSISSNHRKKRLACERLLKKHGALFAHDRRDLAREYATLGSIWYHEGNLREAVRTYLTAVRVDPLNIHTYSGAIRAFLRPRTLGLVLRRRVGCAS